VPERHAKWLGFEFGWITGKMNFGDFSKTITGYEPFDYQRRLADATPCESRLINIPTGLGKTSAVTLAWLWNRIVLNRQDWPRRLVYCLPMRTLVEQTQAEIEKWLATLAKNAEGLGLSAASKKELEWLVEHSPIVLMGGEELEPLKAEWDLYAENPCILVGTQDMLLSRALNRGYGMSRYRWPIHFGLLNTDCLWVVDETQLMGVGVETTSQLDGFRHSPKPTKGFTWWMSATLDTTQLATVDHPKPVAGWTELKLNVTDLALPTVRRRIEANKPITQAPFILEAASSKAYPKKLAAFIQEKHQQGTMTLVVLNRVQRAQQVYEHLLEGGIPPEELTLIHSRFRPEDRAKRQELLSHDGNRVVVATQAVEAGVDISACVMITELAPWPSIVQRFGRCNRRGEFTSQANVFWIDIKLKDNQDTLALPYRTDQLSASRQALAKLTNARSSNLESVSVPAETVIRPVVRRKDLLDLFDTTPDLCGNDLDVSRYIRDGEDNDVQVFWRDLGGEAPPPALSQPSRNELCAVAIGQFRRFLDLKSKPTAYIWDPLNEEWQRTNRIRPGRLYLLDTRTGGYSPNLGWTGNPSDKPNALSSASSDSDGDSRDDQTSIGKWVTLETHSLEVVQTVLSISVALGLDHDLVDVLRTSALWHDVGKAHPVFQEMLLRGEVPAKSGTLWAKSAKLRGHSTRRGFRHELASALAWLVAGPKDHPRRDLIAYLIAAHHGKVRLSIRSLPDENRPTNDSERLYARGVWDGDELPPLRLDGQLLEKTKLDLTIMRLGEGPCGPSWLSRMLALRDDLGPFHVAFLETLLRAADARASRAEALSDMP
jgi:CRISPR-associated endonuclease/helicase Cas3